MHLVGVGSYGGSTIGSLWLDEARRRQLDSGGPLKWMASENSVAALLTNRLLQRALLSGADITVDNGNGPFLPPERSHIVVGLGGEGAISLVEAAAEGRVRACTIHALLAFSFDVYRDRAVQAASALKLWEIANQDARLLIVDAAEYTQTNESAAVVQKRIQDHVQDSVCRHLGNMERWLLA